MLYCLSPLHIMTGDCVTARAVCLKLKCGLPLAQHDASDDLVFKPRTLYVGIPARTAREEAVLYLGGGIMSVFTLKTVSFSCRAASYEVTCYEHPENHTCLLQCLCTPYGMTPWYQLCKMYVSRCSIRDSRNWYSEHN